MKAIEATPSLEFAPEWDAALLEIHQAHPSIALNEVEKRAFGLVAGSWITYLHWVVRKKWLSKHKIPMSPRYAKYYEPRGEMLYRLLEMSAQVHLAGLGSEYPNAGQWFVRICAEAMEQETREVIEPNRNSAAALPKKADVIKEVGRQATWMTLKDPKNPMDETKQPHIWRLIEASLQLRRKFDRFDMNFWKPYVKSLRAYERSLKQTFQEKGKPHTSLCGVLFVRDDRLFGSFGNQIQPFDYSIKEMQNSTHR